jgi:O-antigen biosynthesis protein WbqP
MLAVALFIKIDSPGPIIFKQKRFGRHGEFFEIYKFRTMCSGTPDVPTDQMLRMPNPVTPVGKILRSTSLDELPQLINVLKGDMSIVGPRPALHNQTELNAKRREAGVLRFLPGITGWAQVNGRDELADDEKVSFDKRYCDNWNYWLDWRIIALTFSTVLTGRGGN